MLGDMLTSSSILIYPLKTSPVSVSAISSPNRWSHPFPYFDFSAYFLIENEMNLINSFFDSYDYLIISFWAVKN